MLMVVGDSMVDAALEDDDPLELPLDHGSDQDGGVDGGDDFRIVGRQADERRVLHSLPLGHSARRGVALSGEDPHADSLGVVTGLDGCKAEVSRPTWTVAGAGRDQAASCAKDTGVLDCTVTAPTSTRAVTRPSRASTEVTGLRVG
jgi:hypothetical protein